MLQGLGGTQETTPALDLTAQGTADVTITGSTFDASGSIRLHMQDTATATFDDNLLKDTGIAYIQDELVGSMYVPAFYADGNSTGTKVFQGNRIYRAAAFRRRERLAHRRLRRHVQQRHHRSPRRHPRARQPREGRRQFHQPAVRADVARRREHRRRQRRRHPISSWSTTSFEAANGCSANARERSATTSSPT